ncbi:SgcJ/EcaC family oxidoreductase [Tautonia marina]|uniref:SgcJ/EcaC family oxidoreductase n=1 Tax=Tautonia marina TaxID=2653855 RepID=UPI001260B492|nr:SgcJ/EcaC family oxidoreductase [Tautonia marina]
MMTHVATMALVGLILAPLGAPQETDGDAPKKLAEQFDAAFNQADAKAVAALFAAEAELVDEAGNLYRGQDAITEILGRFFEEFPEAKLVREVEEFRLVGPSLAIEDGVTITTTSDQASARNRYLAVLIKTGDGWKIASMRQTAEEPLPTAHDFLEPIAWLVGDWVSEGADQNVSVSFAWSDDGNFLVGGYTIEQDGETLIKTNQRIGWDAAQGIIRSWNFDSDGGFSEGRWSTDGSAWVVKSEIVLPEGVTGSATFYLTPIDENRFLWSSLDRVIAGVVQPDVEVTIVRQPPAPKE